MAQGPPARANFLWILVGRRVRDARERLALSPATFALKVGISRQALVRIELGHGGARLETLYRIAKAADRPLADLLPDMNVCDHLTQEAHGGQLTDYVKDLLRPSRG